MPYIKVNMNHINDASDDLNRIARKVGGIQGSFHNHYKRIDWEVRNKADVSSKISRISSSLEAERLALEAMSSFLSEAYIKYADVAHISIDKDSERGRDFIAAVEWISTHAKQWVKEHSAQVKEWMEHLKQEQKAFIDKWAKIYDLTDLNFAEKLVYITEMLNHPIECTALSLRWLAYRATREGWLDDVFGALDFERGYDGNFHVNVDEFDMGILKNLFRDKDGVCWQQLGGYTELYDMIFDAFCDMEAKNDIKFVTDSGETYTLWMWKGEYLNLGAGGEMGIYRGDGDVLSCATDTELAFDLQVDYGDGTKSHWKDETWWVTSFNPDKQNYKAADLTLTYTIDFSKVKPEIWTAFLRTYRDSSEIAINVDTKTATIVF